MSWAVRVVRNRYVDSVRLMRIAKDLREHGRAEVAMGTPANLEALAALGVHVRRRADRRRDRDRRPRGARWTTSSASSPRRRASPTAPAADPPRSLRGVDANVALISIPGEYATLEAHRALTEGMHVFLFSDHVSEADEVELKRRGAELGLLVMGPGCGTAMLGEVGLGFANVVRSGSVGIVAAAGTGAQEAASLLDGADVGVSQIVGVGGRDLSEEVGGIMFGEAMRMLAADDGTDTLLLVSKPPSREVVQKLGEVDVNGKRVVAAFVGWEGGDAPFEIHPTLDAGAFAAAGVEAPDDRRTSKRWWTSARRRAAARPVLRRLARARGGDDPRPRPHDPRPRRGGVHAGPPAPDGRPRRAAGDARRRSTTASAACCSTS